MKRVLKVIGVLTGAGALLLVLAAVAVRVFLPPEKAKALLQDQISKRLQREVRLGEVSVGLFQGLRVSQVALSESPTFSQGTFISSDELRLSIALAPLLAKKVVVRDLRLVKPSVQIVRFADGRFNFSDLTGGATHQAKTDAADDRSIDNDPAGLNVLVTGASVTDGSVRFDDRTLGGRSVALEPINFFVKNLSLRGSADIGADMTATTGALKCDIDFAGKALLVKPGLEIERLQIKSGESAVSLTGKVSELLVLPRFDLKVQIENLLPSLLTAVTPLPEGVQWDGPLAGQATVSGTQNDVAFNAGLDLTAARLSSDGVFSKPKQTPARLRATGRLVNGDALSIDEGNVSVASLSTDIKGRIENVTLSSRTMDVEIVSNRFTLNDVLTLLPPDTVPSDLSAAGPAAFAAKVRGTSQSGSLDVRIDGGGLDVRYGDSFRKTEGTTLSVNAKGGYNLPSINIPSLTVTLGPTTLSGNATIRSGSSAGYSASLKSDEFSLAPMAAMIPAVTSYAPTGTASLVTTIKSAGESFNLDGKFSLKKGSARHAAFELSQLATTASFTADSVSLPNLTGKLNGADLKFTAEARNVQKHPVIRADIQVSELDLQKLAPPAAPSPKEGRSPWFGLVAVAEAAPADATTPPMDLSGTFKAARVKHAFLTANDLSVEWNLKDVTSSLSAVNGQASLRQGSGEFRNIQKLTEDSRAARLLFLPLALVQKLERATAGAVKLPSLDRVPYKRVLGDYTFKAGVLQINSFTLDADLFDAGMSGTVRLFGDQALNARSTMTLPEKLLGGTVNKLLADENGLATLAFSIGGTLPAPAVSLDTKDVGRRLLDNLFNKSSRPKPDSSSSPVNTESPASAEASPEPDPLKEAERLFKDLFKKR